MPQLIETPEGWFRIERRDLHLISPAKSEWTREEYRSAEKELRTWFAEKLPAAPLDIIGPSEYSGWIEGGPRYIAADLDASGIAAFNAAWGEGSFWELKTWLYSDWLKNVESAELLSSPVPESQKYVRWWDTPRGILLLGASSSGPFVDVEAGECMLRLEDGWWRIQQLFPEFSGLKEGAFPCGFFWRIEDENRPSLLAIRFAFPDRDGWDSREYENDARKIQALKDAIGIREEQPLDVYVDDYG